MTSPLFRSGGAFRSSSSMAPHRRKASSIAPAKPALETVANSRAERCHARRDIERGMHITGAERGTSDARVHAPAGNPPLTQIKRLPRGLRLRREGVEIFQ